MSNPGLSMPTCASGWSQNPPQTGLHWVSAQSLHVGNVGGVGVVVGVGVVGVVDVVVVVVVAGSGHTSQRAGHPSRTAAPVTMSVQSAAALALQSAGSGTPLQKRSPDTSADPCVSRARSVHSTRGARGLRGMVRAAVPHPRGFWTDLWRSPVFAAVAPTAVRVCIVRRLGPPSTWGATEASWDGVVGGTPAKKNTHTAAELHAEAPPRHRRTALTQASSGALLWHGDATACARALTHHLGAYAATMLYGAVVRSIRPSASRTATYESARAFLTRGFRKFCHVFCEENSPTSKQFRAIMF